MKINIPVIWEMCGMVQVEANSLEEAIAEFHRVEDDLPLPESSDYVDGSFVISTEDVDILQAYNPGVPMDNMEGEDT